MGQETVISRTKLFYRHLLKFYLKADEWVLMLQSTTLSSVKDLPLAKQDQNAGLITKIIAHIDFIQYSWCQVIKTLNYHVIARIFLQSPHSLAFRFCLRFYTLYTDWHSPKLD